MPLDDQERVLVVVEVEVGHPFLAVFDNLFVGRAIVRLGLVGCGGEGGFDTRCSEPQGCPQHKIFENYTDLTLSPLEISLKYISSYPTITYLDLSIFVFLSKLCYLIHNILAGCRVSVGLVIIVSLNFLHFQ